MKQSGYIQEQIAFALRQTEAGISVEEVCWKMGDIFDEVLLVTEEIRRA